MVLDQLSLRELTLFEKGSLTELKETRKEVEDDGSLKVVKEEETVAVAQANAMALKLLSCAINTPI
ncbi:hypothetical protein TSUD_200800 [Trifolium subterraneum]|uniref:Uncharacterized protein n=1 Tax=Trifolium subterraneum TaxID=3900 RepID=A0A2Z6LTS9_TRISU|nr:hypothetical protein TSUD_200800 [Trifolium subterraneum]